MGITSSRTLLPCAAAALLSACATAPRAPDRVIYESDGRDLGACRFVGTFAGSSMWAGPAGARMGIESSKQDVIDQAGAAGATHVVWQSMGSAWGGSSASGNAYWCPPQQQPPQPLSQQAPQQQPQAGAPRAAAGPPQPAPSAPPTAPPAPTPRPPVQTL